MEEYSIVDIPAKSAKKQISFSPFGTAVTKEEVENRLSANLYKQLSDGSDKFVTDAVARAEVYIGTILHWLNVQFDLDNATIREIVLMQALYELHMALGHEEAGREYRTQMKNTVIAAFGSFPDTDNTQTVQRAPAAQVVVPGKNPRSHKLHRARDFSL